MKIHQDLSIEIEGTNTHYFDLKDFESQDDSTALYYGYNFICNQAHPNLLEKYKKNIYLNVVPPTEFCGPYNIKDEDRFDSIYSICPFTVKWLNGLKKTNKYKKIWYPFHSKYIPSHGNKKYDVCYHGGIHGSKYIEMLDILSQFNYRYMTMTHGINHITQAQVHRATDLNLSHQKKMEKISECKISVCYNNFPIRNEIDLQNIKIQPEWYENEAFSHAASDGILPQLKSRFIEACFAKTLNLVQRDPWNVIEEWYEPNVHFIYFNDNQDLQIKIKEIIESFKQYQTIIDAAYKHSLDNYTCENLIKHIKQNEL
jgi:hypothetical protein|tara:strand:+ start:4612 stop:5553 length:942 start_codon:yes stop_codon:yes gene_type:complete